MKKLLGVFVLMSFMASCKESSHVTVYGDMMCFLSEEPGAGYVSSVTSLTTEASTRLDLYVSRTPFAADEYPKQSVRILVEEETTADRSADFKLEGSELTFQNRNELKVPFRIVIRSSASGKKIVLRLEYGYADVCNPEYRQADRLVIHIR